MGKDGKMRKMSNDWCNLWLLESSGDVTQCANGMQGSQTVTRTMDRHISISMEMKESHRIRIAYVATQ